MRKTFTDIIQQSASRVAKAINKPLKSRQHEPWGQNDEKWWKTAMINNKKRKQKYARPSRRKLERTSGNTTKRSYEKRSWHQRA